MKEGFLTCCDIPRPKARIEMSIGKEIDSEKAKLRKAIFEYFHHLAHAAKSKMTVAEILAI